MSEKKMQGYHLVGAVYDEMMIFVDPAGDNEKVVCERVECSTFVQNKMSFGRPAWSVRVTAQPAGAEIDGRVMAQVLSWAREYIERIVIEPVCFDNTLGVYYVVIWGPHSVCDEHDLSDVGPTEFEIR